MLEPPGTMRTPSEAANARTGYVDLSKNGCLVASMDMSAIAPIRKPSKIPFFTQGFARSEEHTSELQSHSDLVCRLLLEKKKTRCCAHVQVMVVAGLRGLRASE